MSEHSSNKHSEEDRMESVRDTVGQLVGKLDAHVEYTHQRFDSLDTTLKDAVSDLRLWGRDNTHRINEVSKANPAVWISAITLVLLIGSLALAPLYEGMGSISRSADKREDVVDHRIEKLLVIYDSHQRAQHIKEIEIRERIARVETLIGANRRGEVK